MADDLVDPDKLRDLARALRSGTPPSDARSLRQIAAESEDRAARRERAYASQPYTDRERCETIIREGGWGSERDVRLAKEAIRRMDAGEPIDQGRFRAWAAEAQARDVAQWRRQHGLSDRVTPLEERSNDHLAWVLRQYVRHDAEGRQLTPAETDARVALLDEVRRRIAPLTRMGSERLPGRPEEWIETLRSNPDYARSQDDQNRP